MFNELTCPSTIENSNPLRKFFLQTLFFFLLVTQICFAQWVQTNGPYGGDISCLTVNGTNLFAGTPDGVYLTTNNGGNWLPVNNGLPNIGINVLTVSGNNLFAGTSVGIFLSTNNGTSWTAANTGLPPDTAVLSMVVNGSNLFAGTDGHGVFLSTNDGTSWTAMNNGLFINGSFVSILDIAVLGSIVFATDGMWVFRSSDNGASWTQLGQWFGTISRLGVCGTNLFVGGNTGVHRSTDNGLTWSQANSGLVSNGFGLSSISDFAVSGNNLFVTDNGWNGGVFLSTDNGANWVPVIKNLGNIYVNSLIVSSSALFAGTEGGGVFVSTNNGTNWSSASIGLPKLYVNTLAVSVDETFKQDIIAAGSEYGGVFVSYDTGTNWTSAIQGLINPVVNVLTFNGTNLFTGTGGGIFLSTDGGSSWSPLNSGLGLPSFGKDVYALAVSGINLFAGLQFQPIFRSTDYGNIWSPISDRLIERRVKALAVDTVSSWPIMILYAALGGDKYGYSCGGVIRFSDGDTEWTDCGFKDTCMRSLAVVSSEVGDTKLYVSTHGYGIFLSTDKGISWHSASNGLTNLDILSLIVSGDNLIAGTGNGVFLTTNEGVGWNDVSSGLSSFEILALAASTENLYAGTPLGVWKRPLSEVILPVELSSFTASANVREMTLSWSTATELNNQGFEVQRKFGSNDFVTVGSVKGHGTTTSPNNYTYIDKLADAGKYFYRLKQIDFGGKYEYSQVVEINWSPFTTYKLEQNYPNPFNPTTTIGFGIMEKGNVRLSVLNILGEEIKVLLNEEKESGYHSIDFSASELPSGVYFYRIQSGSFIQTKQMLLLK
jgi:hypothetical protein